MILENCGAIKSFQLPDNWQSLPSKDLGAGRLLDRFSAVNYPDIRFCSYLRTLPLSKADSHAFQTSLYSQFHHLAQDEISNLSGLFEAMSAAESFNIEQAYTCYLNSRRVIRLEGTWVKTSEKTLAIFLDLQGNGEIVQQLYFIAKSSEFPQLLETAENILLSIHWLTEGSHG